MRRTFVVSIDCPDDVPESEIRQDVENALGFVKCDGYRLTNPTVTTQSPPAIFHDDRIPPFGFASFAPGADI